MFKGLLAGKKGLYAVAVFWAFGLPLHARDRLDPLLDGLDVIVGNDIKIVEDVDYYGNDLPAFRDGIWNGTFEDCKNRCLSIESCQAFTFVTARASTSNKSSCWLKSAKSRPVEKAGLISGFKLRGQAVQSPSISHSFDGVYVGRRGYTDATRPSKSNLCLPSYDVTVTVRNGIATFNSDGRVWEGHVDGSGAINIDNSGINPPPKQQTYIRGRLNSAEMFNRYCGYGYFSVRRQ